MNVSTASRVTRAELLRALGVGGLRTSLTVAFALGLGASLGARLITRSPSLTAQVTIGTTDMVGTATLVALLVFVIATSNYVTRDIEQGTMSGMKAVVPDYLALMFGRTTTWTVVGGALSLLVALASSIVAAVSPGVRSEGLLRLTAGILTSTLATGVVSALTYLGALILKKGAYVVTFAFFALFILPLVFAAIGSLVPDLREATTALSSWLIGTLLVRALALPGGLTDTTWWDFLGAWTGLLVWLVATFFIAYKRFSRESYDE